MKFRCAICGRPTQPFVTIGSDVIGPKCARRAGLLPSRMPRGSKARFTKPVPIAREDDKTLDLFEGLA
jgi:hypothetical protein